jgi:hypothetical protein
MAGGMAQDVERLTPKHKALSSNPSITKKKKKPSKWNCLHSLTEWLKPVILITWEAESRRIEFGGQSGQIFLKTPSLKNNQSKTY